MRGGARRTWIQPDRDAAVWCPSGRWGPRRVRTTECFATISAETIYTELLKQNAAATKPGARGKASCLTGRDQSRYFEVSWELRRNEVWRRGRLFLQCDHCLRRATRLYAPTSSTPIRCRRCWGLTYPSQQASYKRTGWSAVLGPVAACQTLLKRERQVSERKERYRQRREFVRSERQKP